MRDQAGQCRQRPVLPKRTRSPLVMLVMAYVILVLFRPLSASEPDLLHEEIGVSYDELVAGVQAAYAKARSRTLQAAQILFPDDGDEYAPDAVANAMALYEDSLALIRETESRYSQAYEKIPLLFVQLDYLVVKNLSGMAAIFSLRGELDAAHEMRTTLIPMAEENRARIAFAIKRNILPQFHAQYQEIDDSFRQLLAESYVWMGVDAEAAGSIDAARANYTTALELSDNPDSQDAIRVLLERLEFMHRRTVLTAGGDKSAPSSAEPAAEGGSSPISPVDNGPDLLSTDPDGEP